MDRNAPREDVATKPLKPARVALNVLALCFALSVLGRGLGESFTVFLKPISESFGWDRAQVVSVYSLSALAADVLGVGLDPIESQAARGRALVARTPGLAQTRIVDAIVAMPAAERRALTRALGRLVTAIGADQLPARMLFEDENGGRRGR